MIVGITIINGLLLHLMWGWFMVPLGLPEITVVHALGIAVVVSLLTRQQNMAKEQKDFGEFLIAWIFGCVITLIVGAILHGMMP